MLMVERKESSNDICVTGESEETGDCDQFCPEDQTGGGCGDRYDRHGVRIEQNCFI